MGLEPIRLRTRTSNVPVCQFQHCRASCIIRWSQKKVNTQFYRFGKFFLYNQLFLALMPYECYTLSMQRTEIVHPFPPFFRSDSHILILGSFPSVKSREQMFFYGHLQNRFWRVLAAVFEDAAPSSIPEKRIFLERNHVALWDSIGRCTIEGPGRNHAAQLAIVMQMSRQESRSSAGPDHVTLQALITWLIKYRSRD